MNSAIRNRLLTILFVFGLGIYALLPSLRYGLMDESKKSNLSDEQIDYFESRSIKPVSYTHLTLPTNREV